MSYELGGLIIAGMSIGINTIFKFVEHSKKKPVAKLTINRVFFDANSMLVNLSVINCSKTPFSILNLFIERGNVRYDACRIKNSIPVLDKHEFAFLDIETDFLTYTYKNESALDFSLIPFNVYAYLQQYQAETGWVVFNLPYLHNADNSFAIRISVVDKIIYAIP